MAGRGSLGWSPVRARRESETRPAMMRPAARNRSNPWVVVAERNFPRAGPSIRQGCEHLDTDPRVGARERDDDPCSGRDRRIACKCAPVSPGGRRARVDQRARRIRLHRLARRELNDNRSRHGAAATPSSPVADSRLTLAYETGFLSGKTTGPGIVVPAARREADPFQPASRRTSSTCRGGSLHKRNDAPTERYGQPRRTVMPKLFATRKRAPTKKRGSTPRS